MKIAFIGCGAMGEVLLESALSLKGMARGSVHVVEARASRRSELARRYRVPVGESIEEAVRRAGVIVCAVKPQQMADVLTRMRPMLTPRHTIVSIAAGVPIRSIRRATGGITPVVRAMPNLPLQVGAGITAVCASSDVTSTAMRFVRRLFGVRGDVVDMPERLMDAVTAVSGSGPAYVFFLAEMLENAARRLGMTMSDASRIATATVVGAARMLEVSGLTAARLRERVTSRGGTTERALEEMRRSKLPEAFLNAVQAARDRAQELAAVVGRL